MTEISTLECLLNKWPRSVMCQLNQISCSHVRITCLFEHVAPFRDSLLQTDGHIMAASLFLPSDTYFCSLYTNVVVIYLKREQFCFVSVGMRAAPSAVGSVRVTVMVRRTSVQKSSMPAHPLTPSQAPPWDRDATLLLW